MQRTLCDSQLRTSRAEGNVQVDLAVNPKVHEIATTSGDANFTNATTDGDVTWTECS